MHCGEPPLSKYQVDMHVNITSLRDIDKTKPLGGCQTVYAYTRGIFWKVAREVDPGSLGSHSHRSKFPVIFSDIKVDEQPAY